MLISFEVKPYDGQEMRGRVGLFKCECGCGQTFFAPVITRYPRYVNKTHRARAYRARATARAWAGRDSRQSPADVGLFETNYAIYLGDLLSMNRGR